MTLPCKWITDQAGPLVCRKGQHGFSWSICASGTECPGALPAEMNHHGHRGSFAPPELNAIGSLIRRPAQVLAPGQGPPQ